MNSPAENIKARLSIQDIVSSYVKLEKSGANYKARCPFHNEKTPSFYVSPDRGSYHCFGCNRGGDIFTFVEEIEGLDFRGALKMLAERAGVELSDYNPAESKERERMYKVLAEASLFFENNRQNNVSVNKYLKDRGLTEETISKWMIGFANPEWRELHAYLTRKGFTDIEMEKAGLVIKSPKGYFDRFRSRIMFPLSDAQGRIVGFSGRIFGEGENDPKNAKYVNSPETSVYKKSEILFGFDKAKRSISQNDLAILVEGQFDLIMAHQAGTENTVAVSGTALTESHLGLIKRFTENLNLAFDSDNAGFKAARRGVELALGMGMDVKIIELPDKKDPAELIQENVSLWRELQSEAKHIVEFVLDKIIRETTGEREIRLAIQKEIVPLISRIKARLDQTFFIKKVAEKTGIPEGDVRDAVGEVTVSGIETEVNAPEPRHESFAFRRLVGLILHAKDNKEIESIRERLESELGELKGHVDKMGVPEETLLFEAEMHYGGKEGLGREAEELLITTLEKNYEETLAKLVSEMRQKGGDDEDEILKKINHITKKIHDIKKSRQILE